MIDSDTRRKLLGKTPGRMDPEHQAVLKRAGRDIDEVINVYGGDWRKAAEARKRRKS